MKTRLQPIVFKGSPTLARKIKRAAGREGQTVSTYLRRVLERELRSRPRR